MSTAPYETGSEPRWELRDRLRKAREVAGLEQQQLAAELGIARNSVGNYEAGRTTPSRPVLMAWALRTGVPLSWLIGPPPAGNGVSQECARQDSNLQPSDPKSLHSRTSVGVSPDLPGKRAA